MNTTQITIIIKIALNVKFTDKQQITKNENNTCRVFFM